MLIETMNLKNGQTLKIYQDCHGFSPREWDNMATFICFHKRYNLGDDHNINHGDYESWDELIEANTSEDDIVVPLYLLDHGQLSISTSPFMCPWDSGRVGYATVSKTKIIEEYGDDSPQNRAKALRCLEAEVNTYDHYLQGSVYGYELFDAWDREIDSCWGFYGYDHRESGLFENAGIEEYVA